MIVTNIKIPHNSVRNTMVIMQGENPLFTIGRGSYIVSASVQCGMPANLHIGQFCSLATDITFMLQIDKDYSRVSTSSDKLIAPVPVILSKKQHRIKGQIIIKNDVWLGHNVTIMSGVTVGNGAIIAANSHVVSDVPPYAIVGGNPAKVIKYRFSEEQIEELEEIEWWNWSDEILMERKRDFSLPISEFIEKYRVPYREYIRRKEIDEKRILLFPDFDIELPLWRKIMHEYCDLCKIGKNIGQLYIYIYG